jgi:hypothetical protein
METSSLLLGTLIRGPLATYFSSKNYHRKCGSHSFKNIKSCLQHLGNKGDSGRDRENAWKAASGYRSSGWLPRKLRFRKSLLSKVPSDGMLGYRHSAFTTREISFERITPLSPPSAFLLQLLGFVYPRHWRIALQPEKRHGPGA